MSFYGSLPMRTLRLKRTDPVSGSVVKMLDTAKTWFEFCSQPWVIGWLHEGHLGNITPVHQKGPNIYVGTCKPS